MTIQYRSWMIIFLICTSILLSIAFLFIVKLAIQQRILEYPEPNGNNS